MSYEFNDYEVTDEIKLIIETAIDALGAYYNDDTASYADKVNDLYKGVLKLYTATDHVPDGDR